MPKWYACCKHCTGHDPEFNQHTVPCVVCQPMQFNEKEEEE